jgi:hypothetical protein
MKHEPITSDEVIEAIAALSRHKAAGGDGLNNDFFKDHQAPLVSAMVAIGNKLLQGGEPPKSFLEGLILPLRKKGDSADAMNFVSGLKQIDGSQQQEGSQFPDATARMDLLSTSGFGP